MTPLDRLEHAKRGPFTYRHRGLVKGLPSPVDLPAGNLLGMLQRGPEHFVGNMPLWKSELLFQRWVAHHDLPEVRQAERLWYLIDRYADAIEYDLRAHSGEDLGELWRARRWRYLLNLIDHLPAHSHYAAMVANDEEHADMLTRALAAREESGASTPKGPPLTQWTPEVAVLADVVDAVNALRHVLIAVNSEKGKTPKAPAPYARPQTAMASAKKRAEHSRRLQAHKSLAARLLPHKYGSDLQRVGVSETSPPTGQKPVSPATAFLRRKAGLAD